MMTNQEEISRIKAIEFAIATVSAGFPNPPEPVSDVIGASARHGPA